MTIARSLTGNYKAKKRGVNIPIDPWFLAIQPEGVIRRHTRDEHLSSSVPFA